MSSPVSPGARDLWRKRTGVQQLGSGMLDDEPGPRPAPNHTLWLEGGYKPGLRTQVSTCLMPEITAGDTVGMLKVRGQECHYCRHQGGLEGWGAGQNP